MTVVTDGRNLESVLDLTLANISILTTLRAPLLDQMINMTEMTRANGLVTRGVRGACSHEDAEIVLHQRHVNHLQTRRKSA